MLTVDFRPTLLIVIALLWIYAITSYGRSHIVAVYRGDNDTLILFFIVTTSTVYPRIHSLRCQSSGASGELGTIPVSRPASVNRCTEWITPQRNNLTIVNHVIRSVVSAQLPQTIELASAVICKLLPPAKNFFASIFSE